MAIREWGWYAVVPNLNGLNDNIDGLEGYYKTIEIAKLRLEAKKLIDI